MAAGRWEECLVQESLRSTFQTVPAWRPGSSGYQGLGWSTGFSTARAGNKDRCWLDELLRRSRPLPVAELF